MALKITRTPLTDIEAVYNIAKTSQYFDKSVYEGLSASGNQDDTKQYLYGLAGAKDKTASAFNQTDYNYLSSPEDKASYVLYKLSGDTDANVDAYFDNKVQEAIDRQTYESLSGFEKTIHSISGIIGNALNETVLGTIEGLVDLGAVLVGQKDWAAEDFTGVGANREALQKYSRAYTYLDKDKVWRTANDVVTGISQMAPLFIPGAGQAIYFGAMSGNTAADAVRTNPNIDYLSLLSYTGLVTGVEFVTEKFSQVVLGGAGNFIDQKIFGTATGKGLTKLGQKAAGSWVKRVGLSALSEGLEEAIAEFADTALFNLFVAQGDKNLRKDYSMQDIIYAGIVGGLIGFVMETGRIAATRKLSITEDGRVVRTKQAKELGLKTIRDLTKIQSLAFGEKLAQAKAFVEKDSVADLQTKYADLSLKQIQELHPDEYQKALAKNEKIAEQMTEITLGLNRVYELAGEEGFKRATDLANSVFETQQRLLSNYVSKATGTSVQNRAVETEFANKNLGASLKVNDQLTAEQIRLKNNFKNKYGIDVFYGEIGTKDGLNRKFGLTLNEKTIVLDVAQFGLLSEQEVLNKFVKEELVHTLQFTKGIITPRTLFEIHKAMGNTDVIPKELDPAYADETGLTKLSEAQAKAVAEVLLFDQLTVSKMFYTQYSTMSKVYRFFKNIKTKIEESKELRTEKGKLKYRTLLKSMKMYRDIAAEKIGNAENLYTVVKDFQLTQQEEQQLKDSYVEKTDVGPIEEYEEIMYAKERNPDKIPELYNEDGSPKTFYKGADVSGITQFDNSLGNKKDIVPGASWFSDDRYIASTYVDKKNPESSIYSVKLNVKNPLVIDAEGRFFSEAFDGKRTNELAQDAKEKGYDALIIKNVIDHGVYDFAMTPSTVVAVFDQTRVDITSEDKNILRRERTGKGREVLFGETSNAFEQKALDYLNDFLYDDKISISKPGESYFVNQAKNNTVKTLIVADSIQELMTELQNKNLITENVMTNVDSILSSGNVAETIIKTTSDGQERIISGEVVEVQKTSTKPSNKNTTSFAYTQTDIFDYLDVDYDENQKTEVLEKAVEQENEHTNKVEKTRVKSKAEELLKLFNNRDVSLFQGDVNDPEVERVSDSLFDEHPDEWADITPDEFISLKNYFVVRIGDDPVYGAATNALIRYGWLNRKTQFKSVEQYLEALYAQWIATGAQAIGLTSSDYETTISRFLTQLATEHGVSDIPLTSDIFMTVVPKIDNKNDLIKSTEKDITDLKNQLSEAKNETQRKNITEKIAVKQSLLKALNNKNDLDIFKALTAQEVLDLTEKLNKTEDPLDKRDLRNTIKLKRTVIDMLTEKDFGHAIDYQLKLMFEENTDIESVLEKQANVYSDIVRHLVEHSEFKDGKFTGMVSKKIPASKNMKHVRQFFMGLESFRYLMMLSNPATAIKNMAANTLILTQSIVEDFATKYYENKPWLIQATQGRYTGSYDKTFKEHIEKKYGPKIKNDAKGDKYTSTELQRLQQQYAEATDPLAKTKTLSKLQKIERKALSDEWAVYRRTLMNLTNTLAGTSNIILSQSIDYLKTKYMTQDEQKAFTTDLLIKNIAKTNQKLAENLKNALSGDKVAILEVAEKAGLDIVKADLKNDKTIYYNAFKRANKLLLKTESYFTNLMSRLNKSHPAAAYVIRHFIPFVRVAANSTQYIIDRSPIGIAKAIVNSFKTKRKWTYEMRDAINNYWKQQFAAEKQSTNPDVKATNEDYVSWLNNLNDVDGISAVELKQALNGDDKLTRKIFDEMVQQGWVSREQIGSNNLFERADIMEQLAQGTTGTAMIVLGMLFAALLDFGYDDDDDYLGPVLKINNIKIGLDEISPFSTLFTMGAMLNSDVDDKFETIFKIFADASILSTFDSALSYSDGAWDYLKNQSINIATQYVPAFTKAVSKIWHNKKKDKGSAYGEKLFNSLLANTLFFNWAVPNKINPYTGEPEKYYDTGWVEALTDTVLPVGLRIVDETLFEAEARKLNTKTSGLSGKFTINDVDYTLSGKTKQKYATYKAQYINNRFENIINGNEKVTIKDEKTGKYKTTTYDKLTNDEKQRVLKNLYSTGTTITKIQYWLDRGNSYYVSDKEQYWEYKKTFGSDARIVYNKNWKKSKFVEG